MGGVGSVCTELTVWEGKTMKTAVKHCVSSAYQIGTGGGVEGRRGLAPPPIRLRLTRLYVEEFAFRVLFLPIPFADAKYHLQVKLIHL